MILQELPSSTCQRFSRGTLDDSCWLMLSRILHRTHLQALLRMILVRGLLMTLYCQRLFLWAHEPLSCQRLLPRIFIDNYLWTILSRNSPEILIKDFRQGTIVENSCQSQRLLLLKESVNQQLYWPFVLSKQSIVLGSNALSFGMNTTQRTV